MTGIIILEGSPPFHNEEGYRRFDQNCRLQYNLASNTEPEIFGSGMNLRGDRSLTLRYIPHNRRWIKGRKRGAETCAHRLWGF